MVQELIILLKDYYKKGAKKQIPFHAPFCYLDTLWRMPTP